MSRLPLMAAAATVLFALSSMPTTADAQGMRYTVSRHRPYQNSARNNYLSARYDRLLQTNRAFRRYRMWKECHTISWPELHNSCLASFDQYEPWLGRRR